MAFSAVTLAVMFSVLASFDGPLALVAMSIAPLLYLTMRLQAQRMSSGAERMRELESRLVERLYESFSTIRLVKGFAREPHELRRFSGAASEAMDARVLLATARVALRLPHQRRHRRRWPGGDGRRRHARARRHDHARARCSS